MQESRLKNHYKKLVCPIHKQSEKEIKSTTPFTIDSDTIIKDTGLKLAKENYP